MKRMQQPCTFFSTYETRLGTLAERHNVQPATLKALIEDAYGKCDTPPAEHESRRAMMKLAQLKFGPTEINWLFGYHIEREAK